MLRRSFSKLNSKCISKTYQFSHRYFSKSFLVGVDGSEEGYRALYYAFELGKKDDKIFAVNLPRDLKYVENYDVRNDFFFFFKIFLLMMCLFKFFSFQQLLFGKN